MMNAREAWTSFWTGIGARQGGCLPNAAATQRILRDIWRDFANALPGGARVLDLATGNGAVLKELAAERSGLELVGVDYAAQVPNAPEGAIIKAGVSIEQLPFEDASFDAATSQFGIEYADPERAAHETARVLRNGASICFILHYRGGSLLQDNDGRARALRWYEQSGLIARARMVAEKRRMKQVPTPVEFRTACNEARALFQEEPVAEQLAFATFETLELGQRAGPDRTIAALEQMQRRVSEELSLLDVLERSACDEAAINRLAGILRQEGIDVEPPGLLTGPAGAFAWLLNGAKGELDRRS